MAMQLSHIIYVSRASHLMRPTELVELLRTAREINESNRITGMLVYKDQSFMQVLEGAKKSVCEIYDKIKRDKRHCRVKTLADEPIADRSFADWSMGFKNLTGIDTTLLNGYSDFFESSFDVEELKLKANKAFELLLYFRGLS